MADAVIHDSLGNSTEKQTSAFIVFVVGECYNQDDFKTDI
jgi:hypothetical protein